MKHHKNQSQFFIQIHFISKYLKNTILRYNTFCEQNISLSVTRAERVFAYLFVIILKIFKGNAL